MFPIFICYDTNQRRYFKSKGIQDIVYGLHPKTLRPFWIYERDSYFNMCFKDWLSTKDVDKY